MITALKETWKYREMLRTLTVMDLRTKYKGSVLGFLWTFVNPLLMIVIYTIIFHSIMKVSMPHYIAYVFIGLLPWNMFQTAILSGTGSIVQYANMVKKIYFPRHILPFSMVLSNATNYVLSLLILVPVLYLNSLPLSWEALWFPLILLVQLAVMYPIVIALSVIQVYLRDVQHMMVMFLMAWFYFTPVIYSISMIPRRFMWLFWLNPMTSIVESYQRIFYKHTAPNSHLLIWLALAILLTVLAHKIFRRLNRRIAEEV